MPLSSLLSGSSFLGLIAIIAITILLLICYLLKEIVVDLVKANPSLLNTFSTLRKAVQDTTNILLGLKDSLQSPGLERIYKAALVSIVFCNTTLFFQELALTYQLKDASFKSTFYPTTHTELAVAGGQLHQLNHDLQLAINYWSTYCDQQFQNYQQIEDSINDSNDLNVTVGYSIVTVPRLPERAENITVKPELDIAERAENITVKPELDIAEETAEETAEDTMEVKMPQSRFEFLKPFISPYAATY